MKYNSNIESTVAMNTDRAKPIMFKMEYYGRHYLDQATGYNELRPSTVFRLGNYFRLTGQLNYGNNRDALQYVASIQTADNTSQKMTYMLGRMKQQTYGITLNVQYNLTPDFAFQYYGSPFTSIATFDDFKIATNTGAKVYKDRFLPVSAQQLTLQGDQYKVNYENQALSFKNPNFSFNELRSILVARWEYLPGSTMYLVWEHNRSNRSGHYYAGWVDNLDRMFSLHAANTVMLKVNYWFTL